MEAPYDDHDDAIAPDEPQVSNSEAILLSIARNVITRSELELGSLDELPPKLGTTAAHLLDETLRQLWSAVWRAGGWRVRSSIAGGRGRLWDVAVPQRLEITERTVALIRWMATAASKKSVALPSDGMESIGDQLFMYLAVSAASRPVARLFASQASFRSSALVQLAFPHLVPAPPQAVEQKPKRGKKAIVPVNPFSRLVSDAGAVVVEGLSDEIARRWHSIEISKRSMTDPEELIALGAAQDLALSKFMDACDGAGRRDLCSWIIDAARPMIERDVRPEPGELSKDAPLSLRSRARESAGALLRAIVRLGAWDQEHRSVHFIEDAYRPAQVLLERFEPIGTAGVNRAAAWLIDLSSFPTSKT